MRSQTAYYNTTQRIRLAHEHNYTHAYTCRFLNLLNDTNQNDPYIIHTAYDCHYH